MLQRAGELSFQDFGLRADHCACDKKKSNQKGFPQNRGGGVVTHDVRSERCLYRPWEGGGKDSSIPDQQRKKGNTGALLAKSDGLGTQVTKEKLPDPFSSFRRAALGLSTIFEKSEIRKPEGRAETTLFYERKMKTARSNFPNPALG